MKTHQDLRELLNRIDHRGYPAYKDTRGSYQFDKYVLSIDHVQGDPFAAPSKVSIHVPGKTGRGAAAGIMGGLQDRYTVLDQPPTNGKDVNELLQRKLGLIPRKEEWSR